MDEMAGECFAKFNGKIYESFIGNDGIIKCIKKNHYSSIYGNKSIQSIKQEKCRWIFKIRKNVKDNIYIGISSSFICDEDCFTNEESSNYCFATNGQKWSKGDRGKYHLNTFNEGDTLQMILDCKRKTLSFIHNDINLGVAYDNIDIDETINYKMAVIMASKGDELELVNFEQFDETLNCSEYQYCDNCSCNNCKYKFKYCDNCSCKRCKTTRLKKGNKKEDKPHAVTLCCSIIFAFISFCTLMNTSAVMSYDAECMLYDIKTMDCCYDESCHYGQQNVYYFVAECDECVEYFGLKNEHNAISATRDINMTLDEYYYSISSTNLYSLFFEKKTECYPSKYVLNEAKKNETDKLFKFRQNDKMKCNVARQSKKREKLKDEEIVKCATWWFAEDFDAANKWAPWLMGITACWMVLTLLLYLWDKAKLYYDIDISIKRKKIKKKKDE